MTIPKPISQMEKVTLPEEGSLKKVETPWATTGKPASRDHNIITSLFIKPEKMEAVNLELQEKYKRIVEDEVRYEVIQAEDADVILVAFGLSARICQKTVDIARERGIKVGLFRPITVYPFPYKEIAAYADKVDFMMAVEMNAGQMVEDVRLAVNGKCPVYFKGRMGGMIMTPDDILEEIGSIIEKQSVSQV
jgi:2-oxoglutarate ferredoxin oxidoreductase subunit alpha